LAPVYRVIRACAVVNDRETETLGPQSQ
jgi:hypothetical protein